jgi:Tfp pilus assembly protein PilF
MLDALHHHKAAPSARDSPSRRGTSADSVPATLAYSAGEEHADRHSTGKRLAIVLVAVTALLVWQVAAMNGLLPWGVFARRAWLVPDEPSPSAAPVAASARSDRSLQAEPIVPFALEPAIDTAAGAPSSAGPATPSADRKTGAASSSRTTTVDERGLLPARPGSGLPAAPPARPQFPSAGGGVPQAPPASRAPATLPSGAAGAPAAVRAPTDAAPPPVVFRGPAGETDHFTLALYYQRVGDFENALIHYRAVLAANELNAEAHNNLGVLYQGKGLLDEAIGEFRRATFIDPRYDKAHNNLGVALMRSGKTDAAVTEFRSIVAQDPKSVEALTNLSLALRAAGRAEEARETLQRVLTINGRYAQAHYNLALIYEERGELQRAIDHYEQFLANTGSEGATLSADVRARVQSLRARLQ